METQISNYRLAQDVKKTLKKAGKNNESEGIRFLCELFKKLGAKEARKIVEGKNERK
jgi:hypothetical protein